MGKRDMPKRNGCPKGKWGRHNWQHSSSWNGNDKRLLPFCHDTSGIARSGWRCYDCGKIHWDKTDEQFALDFAYYAGYLPYEVRQFIKEGKPFKIIRGDKIITIGVEDDEEKSAA